jgi:outer membrane protein OmpA-like peptidoglycan-associated protein
MMKKSEIFMLVVLVASISFSSCKSLSRTQKGAGIGTAAGGVTGAVIGRASGNTALGAVIGATVGGVTGAVIGNQMDKQAKEIKEELPNAKVERVGEGIVVELSDKVLFDFNKSDLNTEAQTSLNKIAGVLNKYPDTDVEIQGHTDSKGTSGYNQRLSVQRASAVSTYLSARGIAYARLTTKGFGEDVPNYSNATEDGRSQNRRVEFLITANERMKAEARKTASEK